MGKFQIFAVVFIVFQLSFIISLDLKCSVWLKEADKMHKCCKLPIPIDAKIWEPVYKQNLTHCAKQEKLIELLELKDADKTSYKNYVTKTINDSDWKPVFLKNIDFCLDFAPKLVAPFAKKVNVTEKGCGVEFTLTINCLMATAYSDCPAKFYTDSAECKELTKISKECQQNTDDIIKAFEAPK